MKTAIAILILALAGGAVLVLAGGAAMAQSLVAGPMAAGRYEMQPVEGGIVRLDTATGAVTLCRIEETRMICAPGEEEAGEARAGAILRVPVTPPGEESPAPSVSRTPTTADEDAEIDRAIGHMKFFFRTFRDIAREFDEGRSEPRAVPNRT